MASIQKRDNGRYRARYRDASGREHARHFKRKKDAQAWLDSETSKMLRGAWVAPRDAKITVGEWCDQWLEAYASRRQSTYRAGRVHVNRIKAEFGHMRLDAVKPIHVSSWMAKLSVEGTAHSTRYALHSRLRQIYGDAVDNGLVASSPVSRKTSPGQAKQRPYVATTAQVRALESAIENRYRPAIWLSAYGGLRVAEVAGLRVADVDFTRGVIHVRVQYPEAPLKTDTSGADVPIPHELALMLSAHVSRYPAYWILTNKWGRQASPWVIERHFRRACEHVNNDRNAPDLPEEFRFHDLRHYYASLLIATGCDVKVVQARLRHASAKTTLDTYAHLWPDTDETSRAAVRAAMTATSADFVRTARAQAKNQT